MIYVQDADFTLHQGDVLETLWDLPSESVHCIVTSPPYWGLRDYGTGAWTGGDPECDHRAPPQGGPVSGPLVGTGHREQGKDVGYRDICGKCGARRTDRQLGLEPTPDAYIARMVEIFRELRYVLRRDGTCWVNMGDSYNSRLDGSHGGWNGSSPEPQRTKNDGANVPISAPGLKPKDLVGMPWRLAFALQVDGWYLRADIIWSKPNPMPESVTDRPTKSHEYVFLLTRSPRYYFDQEAVRETSNGTWNSKVGFGGEHKKSAGDPFLRYQGHGTFHPDIEQSGRNLRSVWEIPTQPYPEAHFATYPEALVERCLKAGTSERGCCPECGTPWEREVAMTSEYRDLLDSGKAWQTGEGKPDAYTNRQPKDHPANVPTKYHTLGWRPGCTHDHPPQPCTVLDPFLGSGTTAHVARRLGRRTIGVELNLDYCKLAARRMQQQTLLV